MRPLRYSLAGLLTFTLFVGFTCAALRYGTDLWASAAVSLAALLLLLGLLAAFVRPAARPFWTGFALLGLAYFYVTLGTSDPAVRSRLLTTQLLQRFEAENESQSSSVTAATIDALILKRWMLAGSSSPLQVVPLSNFESIGHSAFSTLLALFGGVAGSLLCTGRMRSEPSSKL